MRWSWGHVQARGLALNVIVAGGLLSILAVDAMAQDFPFDQEMLLDARPLAGSRRVPILEISAQGSAQVDLWCHSGAAQVAISGATIKFTLGPMREEACTPERTQRDEVMAAALAQVTRWRLDQDVIVFTGSADLRFRLSSH